MLSVSEKSKFFGQLHCNQIFNLVILSLHLQKVVVLLWYFLKICFIFWEAHEQNSYTYSKIQVSDLPDHTIKLDENLQIWGKIGFVEMANKESKSIRINNMRPTKLMRIIIIFMTFYLKYYRLFNLLFFQI